MKRLISLFLMFFLVIATLGVGTSQANVIEKGVLHIDVGHDASIDAVAFEVVAVATVAEVSFKVCSNTTVIGCYAEAVTVKSARVELATNTRFLLYKVPWRIKRTNIYYAKTFEGTRKSNFKNPRDGLVRGRNS